MHLTHNIFIIIVPVIEIKIKPWNIIKMHFAHFIYLYLSLNLIKTILMREQEKIKESENTQRLVIYES